VDSVLDLNARGSRLVNPGGTVKWNLQQFTTYELVLCLNYVFVCCFGLCEATALLVNLALICGSLTPMLNHVCYLSLCQGLHADAGSLCYMYIVHVNCSGLSMTVIKNYIIIIIIIIFSPPLVYLWNTNDDSGMAIGQA